MTYRISHVNGLFLEDNENLKNINIIIKYKNIKYIYENLINICSH